MVVRREAEMSGLWSRFLQALMIEVRPNQKATKGGGARGAGANGAGANGAGGRPAANGNPAVSCQTCMLWIAPTEMNPTTVPNPSARKWCLERGRGLCTAPVDRKPGREDSVRATKPTAVCERWISR